MSVGFSLNIARLLLDLLNDGLITLVCSGRFSFNWLYSLWFSLLDLLPVSLADGFCFAHRLANGGHHANLLNRLDFLFLRQHLLGLLVLRF